MKKLLFIIPLLFISVAYAEPANYNTRALEHYELLNEYRGQHNLNKLQRSDELAICIKNYLILQINNNFEGHHGQDGKSTPIDRCGYTKMQGIGENLIVSKNYFPTAFRALDLWESSKLHNQNMLLTGYNYVGIAAVWDPIKKVSRRGQLFAMSTKESAQTSTEPQTSTDSPVNVNSLFYHIYLSGQQNNTTIDINNQNYYSGLNISNTVSEAYDINNIINNAINNNAISNNVINNDTSTESELQNAITWMYSSGLTMYNTIDKFLPNNTMTREEASKFFSVFAKTIFNKTENTANACSFKDINNADSTLKDSINDACKLGIFKGYNRYFSPFDKLTNAQAITVLMRIMVGQMEEPTTAFYTNYVAKAKGYGLINSINTNQNITRGEAAILLYKAAHR